MLRTFVFSVILLFSVYLLQAAKKELPKFGKISEEELRITKCPIDSSAQAYYIFDTGMSSFVYYQTTVRSNDAGESKGFQVKYDRHLRIKVLDKAATGVGDFEIPLYHAGTGREVVTTFKAFTYNLVDGKIVKSKVESSDLILEKKNDNWDIKKFAMPNVQEGSIIEVAYTVISDFPFNLPEWRFQHSIPALYSQYVVSIPQYYVYNPTTYGYLKVENEIAHTRRKLELTYIQSAEGFTQKGYTSTHSEEYQETITTYYAEDVPAFPNEKYLKTAENYISKVTFELASVMFPQSPVKRYNNSWESVNNELMTSEEFGSLLNRDGFLKEDAEAIKAKNLSSVDAMIAALDHVKRKMTWNEINSVLARGGLRQAWKEGKGNCAHINLTLVNLLRSLDIEAYPVALSTQRNGIIHPAHPSLSSFNYVVVMAIVDGKQYLMDATDPYAVINFLPERCLNDKGRIIDKTKSDWIDLLNSANSNTVLFGLLNMNSEGNISGTLEMNERGYAGMKRNAIYKRHNNKDSYLEALEKEFPGLEVSDFRFKNIENLYEPVTGSFDVDINKSVDSMGDMMAFSPLVCFGETENPFKLEKREFPVEFSYPRSQRIMLSITLPEGYQVESLPAAINMVMPDKSFQFMFNTSVVNNNVLQTICNISINKTVFLPEEYEAIKRLFASIVTKSSEKVVLKKVM